MRYKNLFPLIVTIALSACSGGGGDDQSSSSPNSSAPSTPSPAALSGVFIDSPVQGLSYSSPSHSGVTDAAGTFQYQEGETVQFSLDCLILGESSGDALLTPLDLVPQSAGITDDRVMAIASLLQTADEDGNEINGLQLSAEVAQAVCNAMSLTSFDLSLAEDVNPFDLALTQVATQLGLNYVNPETASNQLASNLMATMAAEPTFQDWTSAGVFTSASRCAQCHQARGGETPMRLPQDVASGDDISPVTLWQHSMMAHAFDDPYFQAVLEEETRHEFPAFAGLIEDRCLTCHSPMGRTHAHQTSSGLDVDGFYRLEQAIVDQHAREGVSCTLCHQVAATTTDNSGQPVVGDESFSGNYQIGDSRSIFGPYSGVNQRPMQNQVGYTPQYGHQMTVSSHCATCHTVTTPVMDVNTGQPADPAKEFLEQSPYMEWLNSRFSETGKETECQDCHMPVPSDNYETIIAVRPPGQASRQPFFQHQFYGGNTWGLALLKDFRSVLGIEASTTAAGFDEKITDTRDFLGNESASINIESIQTIANELVVDVEVVNLTGHKLPTAYPSRRVWVHLQVKDDSGQVIFESGAPAADGTLSIDAAANSHDCLATAKPDGFVNKGCYEPHRDQVDSASQVAVYEAVMADVNDHVNHVLLYGDHFIKDNRLPPEGFSQSAAEPGTEIVLGDVTDPDFNVGAASGGSGSDMVHYYIDRGNNVGPFTVHARLLYQSVRPSFVAGLHGDEGRVERMKLMAKMNPPLVEVLASDSFPE